MEVKGYAVVEGTYEIPDWALARPGKALGYLQVLQHLYPGVRFKHTEGVVHAEPRSFASYLDSGLYAPESMIQESAEITACWLTQDPERVSKFMKRRALPNLTHEQTRWYNAIMEALEAGR